MFQELSACVFVICIVVAKAEIREEKKNRRKSVEHFLFYAFYIKHTHTHSQTHRRTHTLTENMRGKFSRFENKAEKCRKKLAIGLTLPNKLTRFRCDAEYQSPPDDSDIVRVLCVHPGGDGKRHETSHEARTEQNTAGSCGNHCACAVAHGLQQQSDVLLPPVTVRPRPSATHYLTPF